MASLSAREKASGAAGSGSADEPNTLVEKLVHHMTAEKGVIRGAPVAFCGLLAVCAVGIWFILNWAYGDRLESLNERIDLLNAQNANLTEQLTDLHAQIMKIKSGDASPNQ